MLTISCTLPVDASPEVIWRHYTDFALRKNWEAGLEEFRLDGPFVCGTKGQLRLNNAPLIHFTIRSATEFEEFTDEVLLEGFGTLHYQHKIYMESDIRYISHIISFTPSTGVAGEREFGFLKMVATDLPDVMWQLKKQAEQFQNP